MISFRSFYGNVERDFIQLSFQDMTYKGTMTHMWSAHWIRLTFGEETLNFRLVYKSAIMNIRL